MLSLLHTEIAREFPGHAALLPQCVFGRKKKEKRKKNLLLSVYSLFASLPSQLFNARIAIHSLSHVNTYPPRCVPQPHTSRPVFPG